MVKGVEVGGISTPYDTHDGEESNTQNLQLGPYLDANNSTSPSFYSNKYNWELILILLVVVMVWAVIVWGVYKW